MTAGSKIVYKLLMLGALGLTMACSAEDDRPPPADLGEGNGYSELPVEQQQAVNQDPEGPVCLDGEERKCSFYLPTHAGVVNCFAGVQVCEEGQWSECAEKKVTKDKDKTSGTASADTALDADLVRAVYDVFESEPMSEQDVEIELGAPLPSASR